MKPPKLHLPSNAIYDQLESPVGVLTLIANHDGLHEILWDNDRATARCEVVTQQVKRCKDAAILCQVKQQLREYFHGERKVFDLPLVIRGTEFQQQAWQQLRNIPYGKTISYGEQAKNMGDKNKARAVGMANGRNPISIIIPCHRVIGVHGKLVGFGGGVDKKAYLLQWEQVNA